MTTKFTGVAANSAGLPNDPRTGKPFTSIAAWTGHEHYRRHLAELALFMHLDKRTAQRR